MLFGYIYRGGATLCFDVCAVQSLLKVVIHGATLPSTLAGGWLLNLREERGRAGPLIAVVSPVFYFSVHRYFQERLYTTFEVSYHDHQRLSKGSCFSDEVT